MGVAPTDRFKTRSKGPESQNRVETQVQTTKPKSRKEIYREFPGGPLVKTRHFYCCGPGVRSLVGELGSHKLCSMIL